MVQILTFKMKMVPFNKADIFPSVFLCIMVLKEKRLYKVVVVGLKLMVMMRNLEES